MSPLTSSSSASSRASRSRAARRCGAWPPPASSSAPRARCSPPAASEGTKDDDADAGRRRPATRRRRSARVTFSNWPLYIDSTSKGSKTVPGWEKATGGTMKYIEDYNDNEEFFAKVRQELEDDRPIGRELVAPTDWMAARWIDLGYAEPIDKANVPNAKNLQDEPRQPAVRPGAQLHAAVAVGHHGHRLQPEEDRRQADQRQRPLRPEVQGPRDDVQRVARLGRPRPARDGQGPDDGVQGRLPRGDREDRRGEPQRPDPALHRQRLHQGPGGREPLGLRRLVRRPGAAQGRQPEPRVPRLPRRAA